MLKIDKKYTEENLFRSYDHPQNFKKNQVLYRINI